MVQYIQVPTSLIRHPKGYNELYLYVILKMSCSTKDTVNIYCKTLLDKTRWKDTRTLKKYITSLKTLGYIEFQFENLPKNTPINIYIKRTGKPFTEVDTATIKRITDEMGDYAERALMLFYYYESYYNPAYGCSFPSYGTIHKETGICYDSIKAINNLLNEASLVKVEVGVKTGSREIRERNKYIPFFLRKQG